MKNIRKQLKESVDGRVMVRKNGKWKGLEQDGILTYDVFFEVPTPENKETIKRIVSEQGYKPLGFRIVGGAYGFVISFRTQQPKQVEKTEEVVVEKEIETPKAEEVQETKKLTVAEMRNNLDNLFNELDNTEDENKRNLLRKSIEHHSLEYREAYAKELKDNEVEVKKEVRILTDRKEIAQALNFGKYPVLSYDLDREEGSKARVNSRRGDFFYKCQLYRGKKTRTDGIFYLLTKPAVISSRFDVNDCLEMSEYANAPVIKPNQEVAILVHSKLANIYYVQIVKTGRVDGMCATATTFE